MGKQARVLIYGAGVIGCYLAYACGGDLTASTGSQRKLMRLASREAYAMLKAQDIPILPVGDDQYYAPGFKGAIMQFLYFCMAKWKTAGWISIGNLWMFGGSLLMMKKAEEK